MNKTIDGLLNAKRAIAVAQSLLHMACDKLKKQSESFLKGDTKTLDPMCEELQELFQYLQEIESSMLLFSKELTPKYMGAIMQFEIISGFHGGSVEVKDE